MDSSQFERLLYEEESNTLDFKVSQYRFAKATEDDKAELVKDLLGFANAWRRSEALILVGVKEVRGGRSEVIGIADTDHLDDHSLQQFMNNLTNRPIQFQYEAFGFQGKQIGIIRLEQQQRPFCLTRDYGKLKRNEVYVRRGSSTDPTKPAGPDEIALMGHGSAVQSTDLVVEFADIQRDDALGIRLCRQSELCAMPSIDSIPDLKYPRSRSIGLGIEMPVFHDPLNLPNSDYYRELAAYEFVNRFLCPVRLLVTNAGQVAATRVRLELTLPAASDTRVVEQSAMPDRPRRRGLTIEPVWKHMRPVAFRTPGEVSIDTNSQRFRIDIDCQDLQPGRQIYSDVFFVGRATSGELPLRGKLYADTLPMPKDFALAIDLTVTHTQLSVDELVRLAVSVEDDNETET